jgi:SET domain-containing protein
MNIMEDLIYVKEMPEKGLGVFAKRDIRKDEIITEFKGPLVKIERLEGIPREVQDHLFNVGVDEYIIAREPGVRTNHSCNPNAGITRDVCLVAMRHIHRDEEVTFDYSMITADDWTLECLCGSPSCRKLIGNYRDLPNDIKRRYEKYTPDWIKRT